MLWPTETFVLASNLGLKNLVQGLYSLMSFFTAWTEIQNVCQKSRVVMTRLLTVVGISFLGWEYEHLVIHRVEDRLFVVLRFSIIMEVITQAFVYHPFFPVTTVNAWGEDGRNMASEIILFFKSQTQLKIHTSQINSFRIIFIPTSISTSEETPCGSGGNAYCAIPWADCSSCLQSPRCNPFVHRRNSYAHLSIQDIEILVYLILSISWLIDRFKLTDSIPSFSTHSFCQWHIDYNCLVAL